MFARYPHRPRQQADYCGRLLIWLCAVRQGVAYRGRDISNKGPTSDGLRRRAVGGMHWAMSPTGVTCLVCAPSGRLVRLHNYSGNESLGY